jgi:hypothetical protein
VVSNCLQKEQPGWASCQLSLNHVVFSQDGFLLY